MKTTVNWLQRHLQFEEKLDLEKFCNKLDSLGLELESYQDFAAKYKFFVIAEILETTEHPNANSLKVCKVFNGKEELQIVCGASNARAGLKVVLAEVGALIPQGDFIIKKSKIRGVESNGMLCSEEELGLPSTLDGIMELPVDVTIGESLSDYLGLQDIYLELAITPNRRKDAASSYGIARDLASAGLGLLKKQETKILDLNISPNASIEIIAKDLCHDFSYFTCEKIDQKLIATRLEEEEKLLIQIKEEHNNSLVNLSNFILFDLGSPNHFYDLDKIRGKILITLSEGGETFIAIGGIEYLLPPGLLIVRDEEKILSLAGLMGGELSKVDNDTKSILVEIANFKPEAVAFSSYLLNLSSSSAYRFSSGCDYQDLTPKAFTKIQNTLVSFDMTQIIHLQGQERTFIKELEVTLAELEKYLGLKIDEEEFTEIFTKLSYGVEKLAPGLFKLIIPSWKEGNIESPQDLLEELLRISYLNKINDTLQDNKFIKPGIVASHGLDLIKNNNQERIFNPRLTKASTADQIREVMIGRGLQEVITWSFYSEEDEALFKIEPDQSKYFSRKSCEDIIKIVNPITRNFTAMRRTFIPQLVKTLARYPNYLEKDFSIFELGSLYGKNYTNYQVNHLAGLRQGQIFKNNLDNKNRNWSFFDVREDVLAILGLLGLSKDINHYQLDQVVPNYYNKSQSIRLKLGEVVLAFIGVLHPSINQDFEAPALFELFLHNLPEKSYKKQQFKAYQPLPYQKIKRDLAFLVTEEVIVGDIIKSIKNLKEKLIDSVEIFDLYRGVEPGKKSIGLSIFLQPLEGNITENDIEKIILKIIKELEDKYQAKIRSK